MSQQEADQHVSICMEEEPTSQSHTDTTRKSFLFRVDDLLRRVNDKAYEPTIVSIGPHHHGKDNLKMMEKHKLLYLKQLLKRRNESNADAYIMMLKTLEERARKCYGEPINLSKDRFVKMMLLDGCFIIELFRKLKMEELRDEDDPIFQGRILNVLGLDLILFENQLPFFVLVELFNMTKLPGGPDDMGIAGMIQIALNFLGKKLQGGSGGGGGVIQASPRISFDKVDHLLGLIHHNWSPSLVENGVNQEDKCQFIECVSELRNTQIIFSRAVNSTSLLDIKFENRVMEIPALIVEEETECLIRNLIAYEQYNHLNLCQLEYVTNYATFMDCLINSAEDVEQLCSCGIFENRFTDAAAASVMFNKLRCNVIINPRKYFCYSQVFEDVNEFHGRPAIKSMAKLRRDYFNSPWAIISIQFSIMTLVLAFLQLVMPFLTKS